MAVFNFRIVFITFLLAKVHSLSVEEVKTHRPIIGILAEKVYGSSSKSYIAASYVKYIESAGGRVVPIFPDMSEDKLEKLFYSINGVLFPGGGVDLSKSGYAKNGKFLYNMALKAYDKGDIFPVWGSCLGFELLTVITSDDKVALSRVDAENLPLPLNFSEGFRGSRLFADAPDGLIKAVQTSNITLNNHHYALAPGDFGKNDALSSFYKVLSTNVDRKGKEFISTVEGIKYPVYGVQWHPEKNQFEWSRREDIPHSKEAIQIGQYMANFLVNQARMNDHHFPSTSEEDAALIYNYNSTFTGKHSNFMQCYYFEQ